MEKVKVTAEQATQFMELGYTVEFYVTMEKQSKQAAPERRKSAQQILEDTALGLTVNGKGPQKGVYGDAWVYLKKTLWNGDPTVTFTRTEIAAALDKGKFKVDGAYFAYLVNKCQCLRIIN